MRSRTQAGLVTTTTAFCRSVAEHQVTLWGVKPNYGTNNNSSSSSSAHRNGRTAHHMKIDRAGWRLLQVHHQPSRDARQACRSQRTSHARAAHAHRSRNNGTVFVWGGRSTGESRGFPSLFAETGSQSAMTVYGPSSRILKTREIRHARAALDLGNRRLCWFATSEKIVALDYVVMLITSELRRSR